MAGTSGIIGSGNVIFYHPLDDLEESTLSQVWSGYGNFIPGKIDNGIHASSGNAIGVGSTVDLGTGGSLLYEHNSVSKIDDTRVLISRSTYDPGVSYSWVGTIAGANISLGTKLTIAGAYGWSIHSVCVSDTKAVLSRASSRDMVVLDIAGTTLSDNTPYSVVPYRSADMCSVSGDVFLWAAYDHVTKYMYLFAGEVVGNSISLGSGAQITSADARDASLAYLGSGSGIIAYQYADNTAGVRAISIDGLTVTVGDEEQPTTAPLGKPVVAKLDSSKAVLCDRQHTRVVFPSGLSLSFGEETELSIGQEAGSYIIDVVSLSSEKVVLIRQTNDDSFYARVLDINDDIVSEGLLSSISELTGGATKGYLGVATVDSQTISLAFGQDDDITENNVARVGYLAGLVGISGIPADGYPSASGQTRLATAMWAKKPTINSSYLSIERGYRIGFDSDGLYLTGSTGTATWSGADILSLLSDDPGSINDGSEHFLLIDLENTSGNKWSLTTAIDQSGWQSHGEQTDGEAVVLSVDTTPRLDINNESDDYWIDELVLWGGDKTAFSKFTDEEVSSLYNLAGKYDTRMDDPPPYACASSGALYLDGVGSLTGSGDLFVEGRQEISVSGDLVIGGVDVVSGSAMLFTCSPPPDIYKTTTLYTVGPLPLAISGDLFITGGRSYPDLAGKLYFTDRDTNSIRRCNTDGSDVETVISGSPEPREISIDRLNGKMYWPDSVEDAIYRANMDGSDIEQLVTGLNNPCGICLDVANDRVYWTDAGTSRISRANLDGSDVENIITTGLSLPVSIAMDTVNHKIYWTDNGTDKIQRADLDGSNVEDIITVGLDLPVSVALDIANSRIYWSDYGTDKIMRASYDGTNIEELTVDGLVTPHGITLDLLNGKLYWVDLGTDKISRSNLDGSGREDVLTTGLLYPDGIELGPSDKTYLDLYFKSHGCISGTTDLFIASEVAATPIDWLIKNADHNPQIIGILQGATSATIKLWRIIDGDNTVVVPDSDECYQIGDTGRWAWSTGHMPSKTNNHHQYYYKMTGNNGVNFVGQFFLRAPENELWTYPRNCNEYL